MIPDTKNARYSPNCHNRVDPFGNNPVSLQNAEYFGPVHSSSGSCFARAPLLLIHKIKNSTEMSMKVRPQFSKVNYPKRDGNIPWVEGPVFLAAGSLGVGILM
jgi:hypothetical protein